MGWPLNTVESLGSFSVGRYGAPLWLEGRLRLTAGQSGEAPDEVPGSCRSRGPAIGHQLPFALPSNDRASESIEGQLYGDKSEQPIGSSRPQPVIPHALETGHRRQRMGLSSKQKEAVVAVYLTAVVLENLVFVFALAKHFV